MSPLGLPDEKNVRAIRTPSYCYLLAAILEFLELEGTLVQFLPSADKKIKA